MSNRVLIPASLALWLATSVAAQPPLVYQVIPASGYRFGSLDPDSAYRHKKRGQFDREYMVEVGPHNYPVALPPPTVVAYSALPAVHFVAVDRALLAAGLRGEDAIFQRIRIDQVRDRCELEPRACQPASTRQRVYSNVAE